MLSDLRWAARSLRTSPRFTTVAALTLALGIGATTAMYSVIYAAMLRPLPYEDPDRIVSVLLEDKSDGWSSAAYALGAALVSGGALESMAPTVFDDGQLVGRGEPEVLRGIDVGADFFRIVVPPVLGRGFSDGEENVVVITHGLWQRRFGGDSTVIGQTLTLYPQKLVVIGVMPATFRFLDRVEFLKPIRVSPGDRVQQGAGPFEIYGRVPRNMSLDQAQVAADVILDQLRQQYPDEYKDRRVRLLMYRRFLSSEWDDLLLFIAGAVGFVLLIACTNVSTLLMVRSTAREREFAVRASLGASRTRLIRQQLVEGTLLALPAAGLGVAFAFWTLAGFLAFIPEGFPRIEETRIDSAVLAVTVAVSIAGALLASVWPSIAGTRTAVAQALSAAAGLTSTHRNSTNLQLLIGLEVALTIVLLAGAGAMALSLYRMMTVNTGLHTKRFVVVTFEPSLHYADSARRVALFESSVEQVRAVPGVRAATVTSRAPVQFGRTLPVRLGLASPKTVDVRVRSVQPDYFDLLGTPILRGRTFERGDRADAPLVAIVNESAARLFADGVDPIGQVISTSFGGTSILVDRKSVNLEIVGVAPDVRELLARPPRPELFVPLAQRPPDLATLLIFTDMSAVMLESSIKAAIWRVDPALPVTEIKDFEMVLYQQSAWMRFRAVLLGGFAASGLLLAVIGVWAVVAFLVMRRRREIGIRVALGARPHQVLGLMLRQVMAPVALGAVAGLVGTFTLSQFLQRWLFDVQPNDPGVLSAIVTCLVLAALLAAAVPARRATQIDPGVTLRTE